MKFIEQLRSLIRAGQTLIAAYGEEPDEMQATIRQAFSADSSLPCVSCAYDGVNLSVNGFPLVKLPPSVETQASLVHWLTKDAPKQQRETSQSHAELNRQELERWQATKWQGLGVESMMKAQPDQSIVLFVWNFDRFWSDHGSHEQRSKLINWLQHLYRLCADLRIALVLHHHPSGRLPAELRNYFSTVTFTPPDADERRVIVAECRASAMGVSKEGCLQDPTTDEASYALGGLSAKQIEQACSRSISDLGRLDVPTLLRIKTEILSDVDALEVLPNEFGFEQLGGADALKNFAVPLLKSKKRAKGSARGVVIFGPAGTGKSAFAKALGYETGLTTMSLNVGALFNMYVGQSDERLELVLARVTAAAPCIVLIDEIDKTIASLDGASEGPAGRMRGRLMSWLNDRKEEVFVIGTANEIERLDPAFVRSERFDGVFFLDLPGKDQKAAIWDIWSEHFELDPEADKPNDTGWTGADIRACCRMAYKLECSPAEAGKYIIPLNESRGSSLSAMRTKAHGQYIDASTGGKFFASDDVLASSTTEPEKLGAAVAPAPRRAAGVRRPEGGPSAN